MKNFDCKWGSWRGGRGRNRKEVQFSLQAGGREWSEAANVGCDLWMGVVIAEGVKNAIKTCLHEALCCLGNPFTYIINFELTKSLFKKQNSNRKAAEQ